MEAALADVRSSPAEWRVALEHDHSRLRAYYTSASQEVAESLLRILERNDVDDLALIEEALAATKAYRHELVASSWKLLSAHRASIDNPTCAHSLCR